MNKRLSNQRGDAHAVIIIILVIALVGALAYIFMQSLSDKNTSQNESSLELKDDQDTIPDADGSPASSDDAISNDTPKKESSTSTRKTTDEKKPSPGYFAVPQWGIQFKQVKDAYVLYSISNFEGKPVLFMTTRAVEQIGGSCAEWKNGGEGAMVGISRSKQDPGEVLAAKIKVGSYYYTISGGQSLCGNGKQQSLQSKDHTALYNAALTIKKL